MAKAAANYDYTGAHVLVTGGTSGIGNAVARAYRDAGAKVNITGTRDSAAAYDDVDLEGMTYFQLQVTDRDAITALPGKLEKLDILINNAGASFPGGKDEWDPDAFEEGVAINLLSVFHISQAMIPLLEKSDIQGGGSIVSLASLSSFFGMDQIPAYGAAKAGLVQHTKSLAIKMATRNVRVNAVAAGLTLSRMTSIVFEVDSLSEPLMARTPMKRFGAPEEIADAILFLSSSQAGWITGETLIVDGGYSVYG